MTQIIINETTPVVIEVSTPGPQGSSGTATVGTVTTGASGSAAAVTNSGTPSAAVFNFTIPKGDIGDVTPEATAAKNAAEAAATAAAASELAAETAEQAAEAAATAAQSSATSASASASTATTKAQEATTSAANAAASAQSVSTAATTATTKAAEAAASATAALSSANTATTKAQEASDSANTANTKAQEAVVSATTATNKAAEANASAATALSAQQVTTDNATLAIAQANIASAKAAAANTSANDALVQASVATAQAAEATTQATTATTQAGIATTQATTATTQAGIATTQANTAIAQAAIATTKASEASVSASNSQGSASAALASQTASAASAAAANTSAGNASGSAASALAIYGTAAAQQTALTNAQSAASLAQGFALSASSAIQQDLSGVTAQALHRSPNAVTAMFVYDTSKDSDGGAWTEKCQHTSWYNETLNGKWLGAWGSELNARNANSEVGPNLTVNGDFSNGSTGWGGFGVNNWSVSNGAATHAAGAYGVVNIAAGIWGITTGKVYRVEIDLSVSSSSVYIYLKGTLITSGAISVSGRYTYYAIAGASVATDFSIEANTGFAGSIDNISVREVTALTTASGDYYQSTVDGKFYRLWKNLLTFSEQFDNAAWAKSNATITANSVAAPDGSTTADGLTEDTATAAHSVYRSAGSLTGAHTASCYVKAAGRTWCYMEPLGNTATRTYFNLSGSGSVGTTGSGVTASITAVGNDWYRIATTYTYAAATGFVVVGAATGDAVASYAGNGVIALYLWGAQLEQGSTVTAYETKTTAGSVTETFRGNKADFPRLAGIVAEAASVTIYDLTEAGRPMFWRITRSGANHLWDTNNTSNAQTVFAAQGEVAFGTSSLGLIRVLFATDSAIWHYVGSNFTRKWNGNVSERFQAKSYSLFGTAGIANVSVNAVAMTVLPDAPVDAVTGLQVPTIAVATAGGVSVIKHNGTVVNSNSVQSFVSLKFDQYKMFGSLNGNGLLYRTGVPTKDLQSSFAFTNFSISNAPDISRAAGYKLINNNRNLLRAHIAPLVQGMRVNENTEAASATFAITNTYNTGHLIGDIRRAYLADTDVGSVGPAPNLVTNGTYDTDTAGWTALNGATIAVVDGKLRITSQASNYGAAQTGIATVVGKTYTLALDISGTFNTSVQVSGSTVLASAIRSGTFGVSFVATAVTTGITLLANSGVGTYADFDNISFKEVVADRSYKAQGAPITGTLTKTQVAAASQLVAYSGFSAANYLREPYSADLDFGTGEWSASAWVNVPVTLPDASFPVVGSDLVVNGDFSAGTTGWAIESGVTVDAGAMSFATNSNQVGYQTISATAGRFFQVTLTVVSYTSGAPQVSINAGASVNIPSPSVLGLKTFLVLAGSGDAILRIRGGLFGTGGTCSIDNITVKEIASALITDRAHSSGSRVQLGVAYDGKLTATAFDGTTTRTVTTAAAYNTATWIKPEAVYTTDGTLAIRVNGVEVAATRGTPLLTLNNSNAVLTIGNSFAEDAPFPGSISLLKLSATVPTAEQSQWMYEQEKQMFREGAQVTLPDSGAIVDLTYDDATDKWIAVSATNESEWSGLVRTSVTASPAGSYTKTVAASGIQMHARSTTNPGVDINIPSYGLREELVNRSQAAAKLARTLVSFDYVGGFTANTTSGSTSVVSAANITYPVSYVGARVSGSGIPADTFVAAVSATTIYLTKPATATASAVQISFNDFILPVGYEAKDVLLAGVSQREGATQAFTRLFDGFKETIRFTTAPSNTAFVQIQATRSIQ